MFVISGAAELAGVHPQTLRIYEREGLVRPKRTTANARRYSERDIQRLLEIKRLTGHGVNLEGVRRVIELTQELRNLRNILGLPAGDRIAATVARPFEPMPTDCSRWSCLPSLWSAGATITSALWKAGMSS